MNPSNIVEQRQIVTVSNLFIYDDPSTFTQRISIPFEADEMVVRSVSYSQHSDHEADLDGSILAVYSSLYTFDYIGYVRDTTQYSPQTCIPLHKIVNEDVVFSVYDVDDDLFSKLAGTLMIQLEFIRYKK